MKICCSLCELYLGEMEFVPPWMGTIVCPLCIKAREHMKGILDPENNGIEFSYKSNEHICWSGEVSHRSYDDYEMLARCQNFFYGHHTFDDCFEAKT